MYLPAGSHPETRQVLRRQRVMPGFHLPSSPRAVIWSLSSRSSTIWLKRFGAGVRTVNIALGLEETLWAVPSGASLPVDVQAQAPYAG